MNTALFGSGCLLPDGEMIRRGMAVIYSGRTYVVGYAARSHYHDSPWVCLDAGRERVILSGLHLRRIAILGWQIPLVFP